MSNQPQIDLLALCRLVLKGEAPPSDLNEGISTAKQNLEQLKSNFLAELEAQNDAIKQNVSTITQEFLDGIEQYHTSLSHLQNYLSTRDQSDLIRAMESIRRSTERVNEAISRYRVARLATLGPTNMPNYNLIHMTVSDYEAKKISKEDLLRVIAGATSSVQAALDNLKRHQDIPDAVALGKAYEEHQQVMSALRTDAEDNKGMSLQLERFRKCCQSIRDAQMVAREKILSRGPTVSANANAIINLGQDLLTGKIHPSTFFDALKTLKQEYEHFKRQFSLAYLASPDTSAMEEGMRESSTALESYRMALESFEEFDETRDKSHLVKGMQLLPQAIDQLYKASQFIVELSERQGKVPCFKCGHYNQVERKICEKCSAVLMKTNREEDPSDRAVRDALLEMPMTENIQTLLEAGQQVVVGDLPIENFTNMVTQMEQIIDENWNKFLSVPERTKNGLSPESRALFSEGIEQMKEGLNQFRLFLEDQQPKHIKDGSRQITLGSHKLFKATRNTP